MGRLCVGVIDIGGHVCAGRRPISLSLSLCAHELLVAVREVVVAVP